MTFQCARNNHHIPSVVEMAITVYLLHFQFGAINRQFLLITFKGVTVYQFFNVL